MASASDEPRLDVHARLLDGRRQALVRLFLGQQLQTLHQRQAGVDHDGELPREDREAARGDAAVPLFLARRQRDLRDEDLLAARATSPSASSDAAARSPLTIWPLRVRPTHAYVVIVTPCAIGARR